MKFILIFSFLFMASFLSQAQLTDGSHMLALEESVIAWKVDYSIGTKGHEGTLTLTSGFILVKNGTIQGGNFTIDMNSVRATDITGEDAKGLEDHLKGDDFLSAKDHPNGYFTVLNSVNNSNAKIAVSGYLVLKGISNTISFPASVSENNSVIMIRSEFTVNRTLWGINYQSGSVFGTLKDSAISDDITIALNFSFRKAQ